MAAALQPHLLPLAIVGLLIGMAAPARAQVEFSNPFDEVSNRCFSVPNSVIVEDTVDIGLETGFSSTTWTSNAFMASTRPFYNRTASDTFSVTVTAPVGTHLTRVTYQQTGTRLIERTNYWAANGTGDLTVNGVSLPFSFTSPTLVKSVDLSGQNLSTTDVSIQVSIKAYRNSSFPRVKAAPGSATISVTDALLSVEYE